MSNSLFRRDVFPLLLIFIGLILATIAIDLVLHLFNLGWVGRYIGIAGTLLILISFRYSLRKRNLLASGDPAGLLKQHEILAWSGSLLILVHAGVHFTALLPWLALAAMMVNVGSGLTGKYLLNRSKRDLASSKGELRKRGVTEEQIVQALFWDTLAVDLMKKWRTVHLPISLAFAVLAVGHIFSIFLFWQWK